MRLSKWSSCIVYGGVIAVGLSYLLAHYFSSGLFGFYHDWSGWRSITGSSPNHITQGLERATWALIFCSAWWMLWKLDLFISSEQPARAENEMKKNIPPIMANKGHQAGAEKKDAPHRSENFIPEDFDDEQSEDNSTNAQARVGQQETKKVIFPTVEELTMAELLGLSKDDLDNFTKIKSTYRNTIAQYHPDKVSALGAEIREVAEKKAKEINQAYEFFRKKFKRS